VGIRASWRGRRQKAASGKALRSARRVGSGPVVLGTPIVECEDLEIGDRFMIWSAHRQTLVSGPGRIRIGDRVFINAGTVVYSEVAITIGDDVALANEVYIMDTSSHGIEGGDPKAAAVTIGSGTWVGARAIVLPGVTIGSRVVVGAGSVVTKDVPDDVMVGGNPARIIRRLNYPPHCMRAWHDNYCSCPGTFFGPPAPVAVPDLVEVGGPASTADPVAAPAAVTSDHPVVAVLDYPDVAGA
jgi:acetyltransferase-like isoleucine patch superfamily enzyme